MNRIAFTAIAFLGLAACHEPTAPDRPDLSPARRSVIAGTPGTALAYRPCNTDWSSEAGITCNLHVRNADNSQSYVVPPTDRLYVQPGAQQSWSRDGSRMAYAAWTDDGSANIDLFVVTIADGSVVNLTNDPATDQLPAWSPDGGRIAFVSDRGGDSALYVMNADGSGASRLAGGLAATRPSWSADGTRIAYSCIVDAGNLDVCSIGADGNGFARLTTAAGADYSPDYSPDGARILFLTSRYASSSIAVMDADGANATPLNVSTTRISQPTWSPSGDRIAFVQWFAGACNDYCDDAVYVMNADGSNVTYVDHGNGPTWAANVYVPPPADYPPPVALFSFSCTALTCTFDGNASYSVHYNTSESWSFGDGGAAQFDNTPTHMYASGGTYTVTLVVTDELGQATTATHYVTVTASPPAPPPNQAPVARMTSSCTALTCTFDSGTSTDDHGVVSRSWTFGDGAAASGDVAPTRTYAAAGTYTVTLTVTDAEGLSNTTSAQVVATPPNQAPVARFTSSCSGLTCTFNSSASTDDQGIVSRTWTFGTGAGATGDVVIPTVTYAVGGTYTVTLTVTDAGGLTSTASAQVTVTAPPPPPPPPDQPPVARFIWSCSSASCTLDARSSTDDIGIVSYTWDLGKLGTASGALVTVQLRGKSSQLVTLTVKDGKGQSSSASQTIAAK